MPANTEPQHSPKTHYEVLGLTPQTSDKDIHKAYKYLAFKMHPDRQPNTGIGILRAQYFAKVSEAYETLRTPQRRAKYDLMLGLDKANAENDNIWQSIAKAFRN